jgi:hypothetical protein
VHRPRLGDDIVAFANPTPLLLRPPFRDEVDASPAVTAEGASRNCCLLFLCEGVEKSKKGRGEKSKDAAKVSHCLGWCDARRRRRLSSGRRRGTNTSTRG